MPMLTANVPTECAWCHAPLPPARVKGPARHTCGEACRQRLGRERRRSRVAVAPAAVLVLAPAPQSCPCNSVRYEVRMGGTVVARCTVCGRERPFR